MTDDFREAPDTEPAKYGDPDDAVPFFDMPPRKAAESLYQRAFHLALQVIRIHHRAAVECGRQPNHSHFT